MNSKVLSHSDSIMTLLYTSSSKDSDPTEKYYYLASLFDGLHFGSGRSNIHFNLCSEVRRTIPQAGGGDKMLSILLPWNTGNKSGIDLAFESGKVYQDQGLSNSVVTMSISPQLLYRFHAILIKMKIDTRILNLYGNTDSQEKFRYSWRKAKLENSECQISRLIIKQQ